MRVFTQLICGNSKIPRTIVYFIARKKLATTIRLSRYNEHGFAKRARVRYNNNNQPYKEYALKVSIIYRIRSNGKKTINNRQSSANVYINMPVQNVGHGRFI